MTKKFTHKGRVVEFNEEKHVYTVDGKQVPSVSTILSKTLFEKKYSGVNKGVLAAKAKWGSELHFAIENEAPYVLLDELQVKKYEEYEQIIKDERLTPFEHEQMVFYEQNNEVLYIGTFDLLATQLMPFAEEFVLCDIKTTYDLDKEYLSWQLSLYAQAWEQMYKRPIQCLKGIWLPKKQNGKCVELPRKSVLEINTLLTLYKNRKEDKNNE